MERKRPGYDWKPIFLQALALVPVVAHACKAAGIDRTTAYSARDHNEDFAKAWDDAMENGVDEAEAEAFRRAVQGFEEPVVYQGAVSYHVQRDAQGNPVMGADGRPVLLVDAKGNPVPITVRRHSDALLTVILKGRRKRIYAERTELTGAEGGPVATLDDATRSARVAQLLAAAQARKASDDGGDLA